VRAPLCARNDAIISNAVPCVSSSGNLKREATTTPLQLQRAGLSSQHLGGVFYVRRGHAYWLGRRKRCKWSRIKGKIAMTCGSTCRDSDGSWEQTIEPRGCVRGPRTKRNRRGKRHGIKDTNEQMGWRIGRWSVEQSRRLAQP
jgi:hypothetical protein